MDENEDRELHWPPTFGETVAITKFSSWIATNKSVGATYLASSPNLGEQ